MIQFGSETLLCFERREGLFKNCSIWQSSSGRQLLGKERVTIMGEEAGGGVMEKMVVDQQSRF